MGTAKRRGMDFGSVDTPGPYFVVPQSHAPRATIGGEIREGSLLHKGSLSFPGPGTYKIPGGMSNQIQSHRPSSASPIFGTQRRSSPMVPQYTDTMYSVESTIGTRGVTIGRGKRSNAGGRSPGPGPAAYALRGAVGRQLVSGKPTRNARTFGVRHSEKAGDTGSATVSPGPAGYRLRDSFGRQTNSRIISSPSVGFTTANRFSRSGYASQGPAPNAYMVRC